MDSMPKPIKSIQIRLMKKGDLECLAEVYTKVYEVFDVGERWDKKSAYKLLEYLFKHQSDLAFVAEYDGQIVGAFLTLVKPWWDGKHLVEGEVFVHPDYQQRGIGTKLMKVAFKTAKEKGVVACDGVTFKEFKHPLSWYKRLGFKEIKDWTIITCDIEKVLKKLKI